MTIEEKLDWIFEKIKSEGYIDIKNEHKFINELYERKYPITDWKKNMEYETEWEQLLSKLFEDELIANESVDFTPYVLTLKGKVFEGYVKEKRWKNVKRWTNVLNIIVATIAVLVGIAVGVQTLVKDKSHKEVEEIQQSPLLSKEPIKESSPIRASPLKDSIIQKDSL